MSDVPIAVIALELLGLPLMGALIVAAVLASLDANSKRICEAIRELKEDDYGQKTQTENEDDCEAHKR